MCSFLKHNFISNRQKLFRSLEDGSSVVLFSGKGIYKSADEKYPFTPNRNFYYMTGIDREDIILLMEKRGGNIKERLFIPKPDPDLERWIGPRLRDYEASDISGIGNISYNEDFKPHITRILAEGSCKALYFDLERREWDEPLSISQGIAQEIRNRFSHIVIKDVYNDIAGLRTIKTPEEVKLIEKAIGITREGIELMMKNAAPGMMEYEIEAYFDYALKKNGVFDKAFATIAAAGKNATILHYDRNNSKTAPDDLIMFDLGAQYKYYNADISRTFPVGGKFTRRQKDIYNIVLEAQKAVIDIIKPGIPFKKLNETVVDLYYKELGRLGLVNSREDVFKYYFHSVSHYLGIDTHDVGPYDDVKSGMVLTVEPGLYIPEEGIGIRIEDDVLVTENGYKVLSKDIIKETGDIEAFMA